MIEPRNSILSIAIPSYNRADFLDHSLSIHVPLAKQHGIQIYISDNASTDNTQEVVTKWQKEYNLIHSLRSATNIGPDANFESILKAVDTEYVWLLGDTSQIPENGITFILELVKASNSYSAIVVNLADKIKAPSNDYHDSNLLLKELAGVMSCMSCLIYNKQLIQGADFTRYIESYFIQTGIIFEHAARQDFLIRWEQTVSVDTLENKNLQKQSWAHTPKIFEVGVEKWVNFIFSLPPQYSLKSKLSACSSFGKVSGAFSIKGMISLRARGLLSYRVYRQFKHALALSIEYPLVIVAAISLIPSRLLRSAAGIYLKFSRSR